MEISQKTWSCPEENIWTALTQRLTAESSDSENK
jgi:hypothetical protein